MKKIAFMQFLTTSVHDTLLKINSPEIFLLCTKQRWFSFFLIYFHGRFSLEWVFLPSGVHYLAAFSLKSDG